MNDIKRTGLEIAIIGMSGKFPGANNIDEFWDKIVNGEELIKHFSDEELKKSGIDEKLLNNPNYVKSRGALDDVEGFDAGFFGYTPSEALYMSPQMRIMHEVVWNALEHSGYNPLLYKGSIGLYAGTSSSAHWSALCELTGNNSEGFASSLLTDKDQVCTRISYNFNLKGPSVLVQTACSTSLVAVHMACQSLLSGECNIAVAGGLSVSTNRIPGYLHIDGSIYSSDGHCKPFDSKSEGTVESEGAGIVVLKPLEDAIADNDTIHGIILGSAINNDGNQKVGYTAPGAKGQSRVVQLALNAAKIDPETISFIEAHGTGTSIGDPIEIESLKTVYKNVKKENCVLGSVKSNIGHLIEAAGVTGLIKTLLVLKTRTVPPTIHYDIPNPKIDFANSPFYVNNKLISLERGNAPLRAAVSSFGIGGTNAHVILEEFAEVNTVSDKKVNRLLCLSANSKNAFKNITNNLVNFIKDNEKNILLSDLAFTLQVGRKHNKYRKSFVSDDIINLTTDLESINYEKDVIKIKKEKDEPKIIFMFSGQGSQYVNMGLGLYQHEEIFKREFDFCADFLKNKFNLDIKELVYPKEPDNDINAKINLTGNTQPVLFVFEYALSKLIMSWGIIPASMIGHSVGEYVAACISGVFSVEDALTLIYHRGKLMQSMPGGKMLSVPLSAEELNNLLDSDISIAAVNSSNLSVVSGTESKISELELKLKQKNIESQKLHTSHAFHSHMMEPILGEFEQIVGDRKINKPTIPYISNITGAEITSELISDSKYWSSHIRNTVNFSNGIGRLLENENSVFIEIGPGKALTTFINQHNKKLPSHITVNLVRRPNEQYNDTEYLLQSVGKLWENNVGINWEKFYSNEQRKRIPLPTYPFEHKKYWIDGNIKDFIGGPAGNISLKSLMKRNSDMEDWFYVPSWQQAPLSKIRLNSNVPQVWVVFCNKDKLCASLINGLAENSQIIIPVKKGGQFKKLDNGYEIDYTSKRNFNLLFSELQKNKQLPDKIIHLWNVCDQKDGFGFDHYDEIQDSGFYSILNSVQTLNELNYNKNLKIHVISNNIHEITGNEKYLSPEKATLLGAVKVIPLEYSNITSQSIDIEYSENEEFVEQLTHQLINEFFNNSNDEIIAYRGRNRWIQGIKQVQLKQPAHVPQIKEQGVYLITGGFGGLGFTFATHLAEKYKSKLILTGRSVPVKANWQNWISSHEPNDNTSSKIKQLQELENQGAQFLTYSCDVSDFEQMQSIVQLAEKEFGPVTGIIHSAAVIDFEGIVQNRTKEMTEKSFKPKVKGPLVLEKIFNNHKLDFFALFSSVGTYIYKLKFGQIGYNAGNNFLDSFSYYLKLKGVNAFTINWTDWLEVGMSLESAKHTAKKNKQDFSYEYFVNEQSYVPVTPEEGIECFKWIMNSNLPRVAIGPNDLISAVDYLMKHGAPVELPGEDKSVDEDNRPDIDTQYVAPGNNVEQIILEEWQKLFGIEKIGVEDNFFELGGDSLKGMTFINSFRELIGDVIHVNSIFLAPTISKYAKYIGENYPEKYLHLNGETIIEDKKENKLNILNKDTFELVRKIIPPVAKLPFTIERKNKKALFILSAPRTGSTLLRVILAGNPELFAPPELDLIGFNSLSERKKSYSGQNQALSEGPVHALMQLEQCDAETATALYGGFEKKNLNIYEFYSELQKRLGNRILVDKTPGYSLNLDVLNRCEELFEDAIYIHLLRHPYGMILSYEKARLDLLSGTVKKELGLSVQNMAELIYTISNQNINMFLNKIPDNRKFILKYEDLVNKPHDWINKICGFIGIDFNPEMLNPYENMDKKMANGIKEGGLMIGDIKFKTHKEIDNSIAYSWKESVMSDFLSAETTDLIKDYRYGLINE